MRAGEWNFKALINNVSKNKIHMLSISVKFPGPEVIKLFTCSTKLGTKFILLINVQMPTVVGILSFISMINMGNI